MSVEFDLNTLISHIYDEKWLVYSKFRGRCLSFQPYVKFGQILHTICLVSESYVHFM